MIARGTKPNRCKHCRERMPEAMARHVLHEDCISPWLATRAVKKQAAAKKKAADAAKVERALDKQKRQDQKTIPMLLREVKTAFNAFIRARDAGKPCICCGQPLGAGDTGGRYDAGHYRSVGSAAHLRFNELNVHAQRKYCNRHGAGRAVDYRIGLIARIGLPAVEALECMNAVHKWRREELLALKALYVQKLKDLRA